MNARLMRPESLERCCPCGELIRLWEYQRGSAKLTVNYFFLPFIVISGIIISSIEIPPCWKVSL